MSKISSIWNSKSLYVVYPPCGPEDIITERIQRKSWFISIGQFRREKRHELQIDIFKEVIERSRKKGIKEKDLPVLYLCGSRYDQHSEYLLSLQNSIKGFENNIVIRIGLNNEGLKDIMSQCIGGIHTMVEEHFGICIVEMMKAGLICVAHKSGGPESDIIKAGTGFLAENRDGYVNSIESILNLWNCKEKKLFWEFSERAEEQSSQFSDEKFTINVEKFLKDYQVI